MAKSIEELAGSLGVGLRAKSEAAEPTKNKTNPATTSVIASSTEDDSVKSPKKHDERTEHPRSARSKEGGASDLFADTRGSKEKAAKTARIIFTLTEDDKANWERKAEEAGVSLSEFVRRIVNSYCGSN